MFGYAKVAGTSVVFDAYENSNTHSNTYTKARSHTRPFKHIQQKSISSCIILFTMQKFTFLSQEPLSFM